MNEGMLFAAWVTRGHLQLSYFLSNLIFHQHRKKALCLFFFLFDKQQHHVCHFNVDTIIRLSVILQYLSFYFMSFKIHLKKKTHQLQT